MPHNNVVGADQLRLWEIHCSPDQFGIAWMLFFFLRGNEKKSTEKAKDQQNEDGGQSASNMQEYSVEVFVKETQEDKDGEESENESGDDDNDEGESEEDINDGSGIWFCQDCENLPKTLREI